MPQRDGYPTGGPCWIDCLTPDVTGFAAFYAALFGWRVPGDGRYRLIEPGARPDGSGSAGEPAGGGLIGGAGSGALGRPGSWTVYFSSSDVAADLQRLARLGHRTVMPAMDVHDGTIGMAADHQGVVTGLFNGAHAAGRVLAAEPGAWCGTVLLATDPDAANAAVAQVRNTLHGEPAGKPGTGLRADPDADPGDDGLGAIRPVAAPGPPRWAPIFGVADRAALLSAIDAVSTGGGSAAAGAGAGSDAAAGPDLRLLTDPWGADFGLIAITP